MWIRFDEIRKGDHLPHDGFSAGKLFCYFALAHEHGFLLRWAWSQPLPSAAALKLDANALLEKLMNGWVRVKPFVQRFRKELLVALAFVAVLAGPFILRPVDSTAPSRYDRRLAIMTPHPESHST